MTMPNLNWPQEHGTSAVPNSYNFLCLILPLGISQLAYEEPIDLQRDGLSSQPGVCCGLVFGSEVWVESALRIGREGCYIKNHL
jgi:hypothetical protein